MAKVELTLLDRNQLMGKSCLKVINSYGRKASITDLAILMGGFVSCDDYTREEKDQSMACGKYWTRTISPEQKVTYIDSNSLDWESEMYYRNRSIRPIIEKIEWTSALKSKVKIDSLGIPEINLGSYPQQIVDDKQNTVLEFLYHAGYLMKAKKHYTFDDIEHHRDFETGFTPVIYPSYQLENDTFIRVLGHPDAGFYLSNSKSVETGKPYWIKISPVAWLVDETTGILISKRNLLSGIPFAKKNSQVNIFEDSFLKEYLDTYMQKELLIEIPPTSILEENPKLKQFIYRKH